MTSVRSPPQGMCYAKVEFYLWLTLPPPPHQTHHFARQTARAPCNLQG